MSATFDRIVAVDLHEQHTAELALDDPVGRLLRSRAEPIALDPEVRRDAVAFGELLDVVLHGQLIRPMTEPPVDGSGFAERVATTVTDQLDVRPTWVLLRGAPLLAVPRLLRTRAPEVRISVLLPGPWPAPELAARLPTVGRLPAEATGADVVSMASERSRKNLARTFGRELDRAGVAARKCIVLLADGRRVRTITNPVPVDASRLDDLVARDEVTRQVETLRELLDGRRLLLIAGRQHRAAGLVEQLAAVERLLERQPRRSRDTLTVVLTTANHADGMQGGHELIEQTVGRINGRFTLPGGPVQLHYLADGAERSMLAACYQLAEVLVAVPLAAGSLPAALEYVTVQHRSSGAGRVLVSDTVGTAARLPTLRTVNPYDLDAITTALGAALDEDDLHARRTLAAAASRAVAQDPDRWWQRERTLAEDPTAELPR